MTTAPTTPPCRIVVVDDDAGIRTLLEVTLSLDPRFKIVGLAASASDAAAILQEHGGDAIDLVLLDVTLPDGDGIDLVRELRRQAPGTCFALFTGWTADAAMRTRATDAGADALIRKDLGPTALLDRLVALRTAPDEAPPSPS